jgi:hypothetical protein
MPRVLVLVCVVIVGAIATQGGAASNRLEDVVLELRVFLGREEVTGHTRVTVNRAGERGSPLFNATAADGGVRIKVPAGIYDVQAIQERDGRVLNIRWANRLVVMAYPDEPGQHLEVINFKAGFGALQVRGATDLAIYEAAKRDKPATTPVAGSSYVLFVVPAGSYDLQVRVGAGTKTWWQSAIDVPLDRTRLYVIPPMQPPQQ